MRKITQQELDRIQEVTSQLVEPDYLLAINFKAGEPFLGLKEKLLQNIAKATPEDFASVLGLAMEII